MVSHLAQSILGSVSQPFYVVIWVSIVKLLYDKISNLYKLCASLKKKVKKKLVAMVKIIGLLWLL